jgi:hypothetical protein
MLILGGYSFICFHLVEKQVNKSLNITVKDRFNNTIIPSTKPEMFLCKRYCYCVHNCG